MSTTTTTSMSASTHSDNDVSNDTPENHGFKCTAEHLYYVKTFGDVFHPVYTNLVHTDQVHRYFNLAIHQ